MHHELLKLIFTVVVLLELLEYLSEKLVIIYGYKVVLLGSFTGDNLENDYLVVLVIKWQKDCIKVFCSASSFSSARRSASRALSSASVFPLGRVPARGKV